MSNLKLYVNETENFQLEVNIHSIRRELVRLLEESILRECFSCNKLRCCCKPPTTSPNTTPISHDSIEPKKSHGEIETWIKSCSAADQTTGKEVALTNVTWSTNASPQVSSLWNDTRLDTAQLLKLRPILQKNSNVEAFFKKFGDLQVTPEILVGALNLMQLHSGQKDQTKYARALLQKITNTPKVTADYSYF